MSKQSINRPQLACGKSQAQLMSRSHTDDCADRERIPVTSRLPFHTTIRCLTSAEMGARREERKGWDRGAGGYRGESGIIGSSFNSSIQAVPATLLSNFMDGWRTTSIRRSRVSGATTTS